jgi:hypothetical protein
MICVISSRYFWLWSRFQTPDSEVCSSPGLAVFLLQTNVLRCGTAHAFALRMFIISVWEYFFNLELLPWSSNPS